VTSFDTRFSAKDKGIGVRILLRVLGYAAGRIANRLERKGGHLAAEPEGFIVEDSEGPLNKNKFSSLFRKMMPRIVFMNNLRGKLEYICKYAEK